MLLKDSAVLLVRRPSGEDPYGTEFVRYRLYQVMAFERQASEFDNRQKNSTVIYFFPERSRVEGGVFPDLAPGDLCAVGKGEAVEEMCRITSVTRRTSGRNRVNHIVIEAE